MLLEKGGSMGKEGEKFGRIITAMVTPFDERGKFSEVRTKRLATYLADNDSDALVVAGTTGQSTSLKPRERSMLLDTVLDAVGDRVKVIAGTGTNDTAESVKRSCMATRQGAHGLLLVTPYYVKPSQEGLRRHFGEIAERVDNEIVLYNVPSRTAVNMEPETVLRLDQDHANIVGLKEAIGTSDEKGQRQVALIIEGKSKGFEVWSGNDQDTLSILRLGGHGVVSVASHLTGDLINRMIRRHVIGEKVQAQKLHDHLMPLFDVLFPPTSPESSPSAIKAMLNLTGMDVGGLRLPLVGVPDSYKNKLQILLAKYNLVPSKPLARASAI